MMTSIETKEDLYRKVMAKLIPHFSAQATPWIKSNHPGLYSSSEKAFEVLRNSWDQSTDLFKNALVQWAALRAAEFELFEKRRTQ